MPRRGRPLTAVERTGECPRCGARPGQRCTNPSGTVYANGPHARRSKFSTENVHPETLARVGVGTSVIVRDAFGKHHQRIAMTGVVRGHDFLVVWVAREEEVAAAKRENRDPDAVPWPAEDVWLSGDEPEEGGDDAR